jgi:hypothetical protein
MRSLALRKPSPVPLATVEAFVGADHDAPATSAATASEEATGDPGAVPVFRRASRSLIKRRTKPDRRRATVYFDLDVARRLAVVVADSDQEMSVVVNEALRAWLATRP